MHSLFWAQLSLAVRLIREALGQHLWLTPLRLTSLMRQYGRRVLPEETAQFAAQLLNCPNGNNRLFAVRLATL
jgi:hypothetical protein